MNWHEIITWIWYVMHHTGWGLHPYPHTPTTTCTVQETCF